MAAANTIIVSDPAGNRKIDKSKSTQRIDPLVAAVMAVGAFMVVEVVDVEAMIA
jgi:phage terminase large subunit-like protein